MLLLLLALFISFSNAKNVPTVTEPSRYDLDNNQGNKLSKFEDYEILFQQRVADAKIEK